VIATLKQELRREIIKKRDSLPHEERIEWSRTICDTLRGLLEFQEAKVVHFFLSMRSEVMTEGAIREALAAGKTVVVPVIDKKHGHLSLSRIRDYDQELTITTHGILEPRPKFYNFIPLKEVDLMVLPGVAFDVQGHRLGYGAGYYDRLLKAEEERPLLIALAFETQIVDEIPVGDHDIRMDKIITEERVIEVMDFRRA